MANVIIPQTPRTTLRRFPDRASYDRATVHAILDDTFLCVVAYVEDQSPRALPTGYGRIGDYIYLHGANVNNMIRTVLDGREICIIVTHLDGLVLGRSLFNHSVNYRSVALYGCAERVTDLEEKRQSFRAYADHFLRGRYAEVRPPSEKELNSATVIRVPIQEAVAKSRSGPVTDFDEDLDRDCWAGELFLKQSVYELVRDPRGCQDTPPPAYIERYAKLPAKSERPLEILGAKR
jgi:nitroimidazol reductase NimA-like FMN-containing flavoprotein (pyridoxamine 5'-phosphate oxidase superfamily)